MRTLILGASGLVGGNCMKHFTAQGWKCVGTHFSYPTEDTIFYDTLSAKASDNEQISQFAPEVIVHCGALTWVDYCEEHVDESFQKTVVSTQNARALAEKHHAKLVYLSTDYVFDGAKGFYQESDAVHPLSVYGKHKLEAEEIVKKTAGEWLICRITNVYGDELRGKNFITRLCEQMITGETLTLSLPIDQYATPVNAWDVARAIFQLLQNQKTGLYHLASTDYLNRVQLAERIMFHFGHEQVTLTSVLTSDMKQPAKRPLLGGMSAAKFNAEFPDFRWSNVDDYLSRFKLKSTFPI